ncbi:MAG: phosphatidate cytidylyltransferase [Chloroflexi bacterium]|nr:phosphatidate cytidylyltransferase [Chloroflexota bacterium]
MLAKRLAVIILLIPLGVAFIAIGGLPYALLAAVILGIAGWEYTQLFQKAGLQPSALLVIAGGALLPLSRQLPGSAAPGLLLSVLVLAAMALHMFAYEKGRDQAATDFGVSMGGILYLGWLGAYLVSLRNLPDGEWWVLTALPAVWISDAGAYLIGSRIGRHPLSRRISPRKTWEGYLAGIVCGTAGGALMGALWHLAAGSVTASRGALLGLALAVLTILGDLGESMIKRQVGVKDSSQLLPGHGGIMDRIDSWLWAGVIAYYLVTYLWVSPALP